MRCHVKRSVLLALTFLFGFIGLLGLLQQMEISLPQTNFKSVKNGDPLQQVFYPLRQPPEPPLSGGERESGGWQTALGDRGGLADARHINKREHEPFHKDSDTEEQAVSHHSEAGTSAKGSEIWPDSARPWDDRIIAQLRYVPESYGDPRRPPPFKVIYVPGGTSDPMGQEYFRKFDCAVDACLLTSKASDAELADAVVLGLEGYEAKKRNPRQIWILSVLESPLNTGRFYTLRDEINWTATYRTDSTIVTPYEKFVFHKNATSVPLVPTKNYAAGKTKLVAWFVSNCGARNHRMQFAKELQKYIQVDVYGHCGNFTCARYDSEKCGEMLKKDYKFYLSFENSNCQHYITEKFYQNALWNEAVPIAMGAHPKDYLAAAPPHSFIHVEDFDSPKALAQYLLMLDRNDHLYNSYHQWRLGGHFINTKFWCRVCALLHDSKAVEEPRWYEDINDWWRHQGTCTKDRWDAEEDLIDDWDKYF